MAGLSVLTQCHSWIALVIYKRGQQSRFVILEALDAPHVTDKVFAAEAFNLFPFLIGKISYLIYCNHSLHKSLRKVNEPLNRFDKKSCQTITKQFGRIKKQIQLSVLEDLVLSAAGRLPQSLQLIRIFLVCLFR